MRGSARRHCFTSIVKTSPRITCLSACKLTRISTTRSMSNKTSTTILSRCMARVLATVMLRTVCKTLGTSKPEWGDFLPFQTSCQLLTLPIASADLALLANIFRASQHRVSPLRLEDPTKPGHRRFLALWLIDPHRPVVSTATVPPQQKEWWTDAVNAAGEDAGAKDVPKGLMTVEQAQEHRLALMDERSAQQSDTGSGAWEYEQYSFCEH